VHNQIKWLPGSSGRIYQSTRDVVEKKCIIICNKEDDCTKKKTFVATTVHVVECCSSDGCGADRKRRMEEMRSAGIF
jgi:hypothetical protein